MKFSCGHCGKRLSVPAGQAGKRGRCPQCKKVVTIPTTISEEAVAPVGSTSREAAAPPKPSARGSLLFDMPPADVAAAPQTEEEAYERLREMQGGYLLKQREEPPERPLPWIVDIFLYPLNRSGLSMLILCTGIPLILRMLLRFSICLTAVFGPALILWVLFIIVHWAALLLSLCYVTWYVAECIRDSAAGGIRAVDTTASTPGFGELVWQALTVLLCGGVCMAPAILYAGSYGADPLFWVFYVLGGLLFPMALLAVTMFESLRALNPILLLGSVFSTLLPYGVLAAFSYTFWLFPSLIIRTIRGPYWMLSYLFLFLASYHALVLAHLLGRFCYRNEEKLNWDA